MQSILIPIFVCVVLPVSIVFIVFFYLNKISANKMNLLSKAIENGVDIDSKALIDALETRKKSSKTVKAGLINKLIWGIILLVCGVSVLGMAMFGRFDIYDEGVVGIICLAVGLALVVSYIVGKKMLQPEIEAETRMLLGESSGQDVKPQEPVQDEARKEE